MGPKWMQRWAATRAGYRRQLADADRKAATAVAADRTLRQELAVARQRCDDARALASAAEQVATEHGRVINRVRLVLAEFDGTQSPTAVALAASIWRALDGEEVSTQ